MGIRIRLAGVALLAAAAAGCGNGDGSPRVASADGATGAAPSASALSERELALKFSQCVREHGVPSFPDPKFEGNGVSIDLPAGVNGATAEEAMKACKQYQPNGGVPPTVDPETLEKLRAYAKCMRANGVAEFPDPTAQGFQIDGNKSGLDPASPRMKTAEAICKKFGPPPDGEGPQLNEGGR